VGEGKEAYGCMERGISPDPSADRQQAGGIAGRTAPACQGFPREGVPLAHPISPDRREAPGRSATEHPRVPCRGDAKDRRELPDTLGRTPSIRRTSVPAGCLKDTCVSPCLQGIVHCCRFWSHSDKYRGFQRQKDDPCSHQTKGKPSV